MYISGEAPLADVLQMAPGVFEEDTKWYKKDCKMA